MDFEPRCLFLTPHCIRDICHASANSTIEALREIDIVSIYENTGERAQSQTRHVRETMACE